MGSIGRIAEIWRYPVKSMGGERLRSCEVGTFGLPGDRGWAVRDEVAGEIRGAKKLPGLMLCRATYTQEPAVGRVPPADITLPDGAHFASDSPEANARLSEFLGRCSRRRIPTTTATPRSIRRISSRSCAAFSAGSKTSRCRISRSSP